MQLIFLTTIVFLSLDFAFLYLMRTMFNKQIIAVQGSPVVFNIYAAIPCYFALVFGIYYFIIREKKSILDAFLLGIVIYAVFETTNLSLFKKWTWETATIDTIWGGTLFALTTFIVYTLNPKLRISLTI
jgi:uncharacterized membrane protein